MDKNLNLSDRLQEVIGHYGLTVNELANKIGGSRMKFYNLLKGISKPDFETTQAILQNFPEISAEWFMRGDGPMLKKDIVSQEEVSVIMAENKAIKAMYRAEVMGKSKGVNTSPDVRIPDLRKKQYDDTKKSLRGKRGVSRPASVHVQGAKIPSLTDLLN